MADPEKAVENEESDVTSDAMEEDDNAKARLTADMMSNPEVLAALQSNLGSLVGSSSGYIESLPKSVKRRIKALKKIQVECVRLEAKFFEEIHALECKYAKLYVPYYVKRHQITSGAVEPTDEECDFPSDSETELADELKKSSIEDNKVDKEKDKEKEKDNEGADVKGISEFWLTIMKNVDMLGEMIHEHDEPILKHLSDIRVQFHESPMSYVLEFHFEPNEYFSNTVLTKQYELKCTPDDADPFSFEGPEVYKCKGCPIDWKKGKNVTVKTIKKKQKHKSRGSVRTITKTVQNESFFNFFSPPPVPEGDEQLDEDTQAVLTADFEIGHFFRERIIPRAVLFFTGEALTDEDFDEDEEDEDEEDDDDDKDEEDEENDPDYNPAAQQKEGKGHKKGQAQQQPQECKQQ